MSKNKSKKLVQIEKQNNNFVLKYVNRNGYVASTWAGADTWSSISAIRNDLWIIQGKLILI